MDIYSIIKSIITLIAQIRLYFGQLPQPRSNVSEVPFAVVWNVPSAVCQDKFKVLLNLSHYGIIQNLNQSFFGENIVLFYEPTPGLYPKYLSNGSAINGGLPQKSKLQKHLRRVQYDVNRTIPVADFSGLAVIDWESWRPIFDRNMYDKSQVTYITKSEGLVRQYHPTWNDSQVKIEARKEFETAAR
ncbi:hyaluronidase-like [Ylistrum balloti]|uniref:hyaluronidase-like n=1 Tax=Ylistrum balloti TaxID=509963 RepID=UPI00290587DC|nr:hyaluronidase-like [Ylistrum balloti]